MKKILFIGHTFPEPNTTAAGSRTLQLIRLFKDYDFTITFASTAQKTRFSDTKTLADIKTVSVKINDGSFNVFVLDLAPDIIVYDRFITEEQFGWRVRGNCPDALQILDTQDLHFLRKTRQESLKNNIATSEANLFTEIAKREIASILRCDLSLIISEYEMQLLQEKFNINASLLHYLPFLIEEFSTHTPNFYQRSHFFTIGNFLHKPNLDSVIWLKKEIWKKIRKKTPMAQLHIYGAYMPQQIKEFHNTKEGFIIKGWTSSVSKTMQHYKVCLTPLRFGAGLKGKIIDAMVNGTPVVTTHIGAEGIANTNEFCGKIANRGEELVSASVTLYAQEEQWQQAQRNGFNTIKNRFLKQHFIQEFYSKIKEIQKNLSQHRNSNFIGQILQHNTLQSTKYLSKWIEEKNKNR